MDDFERQANEARDELTRAVATVTPPPVEGVVRAATRRHRSRRVAALAATSLVVVGAVAWLRPDGDNRSNVLAGQPTTTSTARPEVATPMPSRLVAILPSSSGHPGAIVVIDPATGATVRTLGTDYGIYPANGFQISPDGTSLYWNRLNEPAQKLELVRQPLDGSPSTIVNPNGAEPRFSSDGQVLIFQTASNPVGFVRRDLATGTDRALPAPGEAGENVVGTGFQQSQHTLVAITTKPMAFECPPAGHCPRPTPAQFHAWTLDVDQPGANWRPFGTTAAWDGAIILGPGPNPGSTLIYSIGPGPTYRISEVAADGTIQHKITLAADARPLNVDRTGSNIIVTTNEGLARVTFSSSNPAHLAGPAMLATW